MNNKITYRQQYTRCGKQRCKKCKGGSGHGPYWYAYWSENGRTVSKYIGAQLPADIEMAEQPAAEYTPAEKSKVISRRAQPRANQDAALPRPLQETQVLRVYLLGQFRVERRVDNTWFPVDNSIWRRRRARALLGCLLSSPGRRLGREQIMEALWPNLDIDTAANRLNGAVHELRQILEPGIARPASSRMLRLERDVLELADRSFIWVDSEAFENLMNEANATPCNEEAESLLEAAEVLYGGDYLLEELYSEWAAPRREAMKRARTSLLFRLSELREQRGAHASAIEPLDRLLAADPVNETAVRRLMVLLTRLDRRGEALRVYQRLATALSRDYETEPLPETRELYEALRLGHLRVTPSPASLFPNSAIPSSSLPQPTQPQDETAAEMLPHLIFQSGRHNQSPLVGRSRELDTMRQLTDVIEGIPGKTPDEKTRSGAFTRTSHFLLLMGEAGIGKTRLAEELSLEINARTWAVVWSRSYEQESAIPYRPWTDLLRALLQDVPSEHLLASLKLHVPGFEETSTAKLERLYALLPELAAREGLPQLRPSPSLPPEQERLHLWEVTLGLLSALSKKTPMLLVLDDLHWADDSSIDLLAYLARHLQDQRVLLVGTYRDAEPSSNTKLRTLITDLRREQAVQTLMVQPLTSTQIGSLVAHLPQEIVRTIQTQAGGNPFFAEELARYSTPDLAPIGAEFNGGDLASDEREQDRDTIQEYIPASTHEALPETIASVLERRLSGLSSQCQNLLGKAAVLGGSFELHHLLAMTSEYDEDALLDLLEEALHAGLLAEEGNGARIVYHFWHPLIVNHLYKRLSAARRAQLHRRAAAMLEEHAIQQKRAGERAATIMYHLSRGGDDPTRIAHYAELAGNQAYA
ncbi:MAG TPA: DUF6788 family protein, partial [Ktedonobacteraceae bacterium]|nr:DUF6788 family protein [Ktedonobacteraceae bacterium]